MKNKYFIFLFHILFLCGFVNLLNANLKNSNESNNNLNNDTEITELYNKTNNLKNLLDVSSQALDSSAHYSKLILCQFGEIFKFIVDKADKLTSKKFVLAILISVGPLVAIYCKYFNPEPLIILISKFFSATTFGAIKLGSPAAKGAFEGVLTGALEHKEELAEIAKIASEAATQAGSSVASGIAEGTVNGILNNKVAVLEAVGIGTGIGIIASTLKQVVVKGGPYMAEKIGEGLLVLLPLTYNKATVALNNTGIYLISKLFGGLVILP